MTGIISFLIFVLLVALAAVVIAWVVQTCLAMIGAPGNVNTIAKMIIVLIALLVIMQRALPLIGAYT